MTETNTHRLTAKDSHEVLARLKRALDETDVTRHPRKSLNRIKPDLQWVLSKLTGGKL